MNRGARRADELWSLSKNVSFQIVFHFLHEGPALVDERPYLIVAEFLIFTVIAALSEIKGLIYDPTQFFREYSCFYKSPVKVTENPAVLGGGIGLEDQQGKERVEHTIICPIDHRARTFVTLEKKSGFVNTFLGLLQAISGQFYLTFCRSQTGIPSFRMIL